MALLCVCFGLRISECMALKWSDVDWLSSKLSVQRGIVKQHVDDVKTIGSEQDMTIDAGMAEVLKLWKQTSQFSASEDWMFASPAKLGRQPWSYDQVLRAFANAGTDAGIGKLGTHSMRHSYRSWLDAVGDSDCCAAKAHAARGHPHHDERLRGHRDGRDDRSEWQSRRVSAQRQVKRQVKALTC
jgi:integrase